MHASLANLGSRPLVALLAYAGWAILLALGIAGYRGLQVLGGKKANDFPSGTQHGSDPYWRLNRAHLNTVENLPIFATVVLAGAALGVSSPRLATLAEVAVCARVAQSLIHLSSGSSRAVSLRFCAFVTQLACFIGMILETIWLATH